MKLRRIRILALIAGLLAGCSASATQTRATAESVILEPTVTLQAAVPTQGLTSQAAPDPTQTAVPDVLPVATSRGPDLEATDPTTVSMASGGLQFVEFFEFW